MKTVTLFELKQTRVAVETDVVLQRAMPQFDYSKFRTLDGGEVMASVREKALPVEKICRIEHGRHKESYIALDDDLREILEAPFRTEIQNLRNRLAGYQDRITAFNALPWYKRWFNRP